MGPVLGVDDWLLRGVSQPQLIYFSMFVVKVIDDLLAQWCKLLSIILRPPWNSDWMLIVEANLVYSVKHYCPEYIFLFTFFQVRRVLLKNLLTSLFTNLHFMLLLQDNLVVFIK